MVDQETITGANGTQAATSATAGVRHNVADLSHDLLTLGELQCQLLAVDIRDTKQEAILPIAALGAGVLLALGTIPVVLLGIAFLLAQGSSLSQGGAILLTGGIALVAAVLAVWLGVRGVLTAIGNLARSQKELSENVQWIKYALKQRGTKSAYRERDF